jgi:hypothetical protein
MIDSVKFDLEPEFYNEVVANTCLSNSNTLGHLLQPIQMSTHIRIEVLLLLIRQREKDEHISQTTLRSMYRE